MLFRAFFKLLCAFFWRFRCLFRRAFGCIARLLCAAFVFTGCKRKRQEKSGKNGSHSSGKISIGHRHLLYTYLDSQV